MACNSTPTFTHRGLLTGCAVALLLGACASTSMVEKWQDPDFHGPALQKILVVSIQRSDGRRRLFEDGMVNALGGQGTPAMPSYRLFPDAVPQTVELSNAAQREGYDGVLVLHQLGRSSRTSYTPGSVQYYPAVVPTLDGKYTEYWQAVYQPGYSEIEQQVDFQTDLFATATHRLIWSASTRSHDLDSAQSITADISRRVLPELTRSGLLAPAAH